LLGWTQVTKASYIATSMSPNDLEMMGGGGQFINKLAPYIPTDYTQTRTAVSEHGMTASCAASNTASAIRQSI
jgi:hypothetical protein